MKAGGLGSVSAERLCVCVYVCRWARKRGRGWTGAISHFTNTGHAGKGYYAKSIAVCVWAARACMCLKECCFFCLYPCVRAIRGIGRGFHTWLTGTKPSLRRQIQFKAAKAVSLFVLLCILYIFYSHSTNTNPRAGSSKWVFFLKNTTDRIKWRPHTVNFFDWQLMLLRWSLTVAGGLLLRTLLRCL